MSFTKREVVKIALDGNTPPYVPWELSFTQEPRKELIRHFNTDGLGSVLDNHFLHIGENVGYFKDLGQGRVEDHFGVVWDRSVDKDIGVVEGCLLPEPTLEHYKFPDPEDERFFKDIPAKIKAHPDLFRVFDLGFSLYERAWTLRGIENLMMDFIENPEFVHELLNKIGDYNIAHIKKALTYDIDAVYFGDDWGQQCGLQMGLKIWREFIKPVLTRMYHEVKSAGKYQMIHSCGDVDELFDDLIGIGLNCFNPFQPEVMDVEALMKQYHGKLAFHGGLSTQKTLPYGTVANVKKETQHLLDLGKNGGYIFSPAHAVEGDVPLENILAFIEVLKSQPGYVNI